jgi:hypothetical protein
MKVTRSNGVVAHGYSIGDLAYLIDATKPKRSKDVQVEVSASGKSPVINPAFLINNWGSGHAVLEVNDKVIPRGTHFRMGHYRTLELEDGRKWTDVLIVWAKVSSTKPVQFGIRPEGHRSSRAAAALAAAEKLVADKQYAKAATQLRRLAATQRGTDVGKQAAEGLKTLLDDPAIGQSLIDAEADAFEARCVAAEKKKDYALAAKLYEQYVRQFAKATRFEKVKARLESLRSDKAIQAAVRSGQAAKECKRWLSLAHSYAKSGLTDKARQYLTKIIEKYGDTDWGAKARARLAEIDGK